MTAPRHPGPRRAIPHVVTLTAGLALGWLFAVGPRPAALVAAGDGWEDSLLATGPTYVRYNEGTKIQVAQDAIYYLDYRKAMLYASIPSIRSTNGATSVLNPFGERDLVADFKLDLDTGAQPHFLMTTGSVPSHSATIYDDGWAPLFVVESTTRQIAAYKVVQQIIGTKTTIRLDLLEVRPLSDRANVAR